MMSTFFVFKYLRLSSADGDTDESNSIKNQRILLDQYLSQYDEFKDANVEEFIDDGFSGTSFDRPDFQRMMKKAREEENVCIITKDFSRLGRDIIDTTDYIEKIFPFLNVRYISVNDEFDSSFYNNTGINLDVKFKNLINGYYPIMASISAKAAKKQSFESGKYNGPIPTYGYRFTPDREYEIDCEAATIVQMIYHLLLKHKKNKTVIEYLESKGIEPPAKYLERKYGYKNPKAKGYWSSKGITRIVSNPVYLGYLVGGKTQNCIIGKRSPRVQDEEKWILKKKHPQIITLSESEAMAELLNKRKTCNWSKGGQRKSALAFKVKCGHCHATLHRKFYTNNNDYYVCSYKHTSSCVSIGKIDTKIIEAAVLESIRLQYNMVKDIQIKMSDMMEETERQEVELSSLLAKKEQLDLIKFQEYENYQAGKVDKAIFIKEKEKITKEQEKLEKRLGPLQRIVKKTKISANKINNKFTDNLQNYACQSELTFEMVDALIKEVIVFNAEKIEVIFNCDDEIQDICKVSV